MAIYSGDVVTATPLFRGEECGFYGKFRMEIIQHFTIHKNIIYLLQPLTVIVEYKIIDVIIIEYRS